MKGLEVEEEMEWKVEKVLKEEVEEEVDEEVEEDVEGEVVGEVKEEVDINGELEDGNLVLLCVKSSNIRRTQGGKLPSVVHSCEPRNTVKLGLKVAVILASLTTDWLWGRARIPTISPGLTSSLSEFGSFTKSSLIL